MQLLILSVHDSDRQNAEAVQKGDETALGN